MKTTIITTALCLLGTAAYATGAHEAPHGGTTPAVSGQQSQGQMQGQLQAQRATAMARSSSNATGGNAMAQGGRGGAGGRGGNAAGGAGGQANNGGQSMNYSGGNYSARGNNVDAFAPSIATANECALPKSAGASFLGIGMSGGFANESDSCKRQRLATMLVKMGDPRAAREALCLDEDMRRAAYSSGHPCAADARGWNRH